MLCCSSPFPLPVWAFVFDNFNIDFASMLPPRWHKNPSCFAIEFYFIFMIWGMGFALILFQKMYRRYSLFHDFFDHVPQVMFLKVPWLTLAPFGSLLVPSWLPFGSLFVRCYLFGILFLIHFVSFYYKNPHFRLPSLYSTYRKNANTPVNWTPPDNFTSRRPHAEHCRRHFD